MSWIIQYRKQIVSLGLLPIIFTLIALHFFQQTVVLSIGFLVSFLWMLYGVLRLKELNFFLLLGAIGIGSCMTLRILTGYLFIPKGFITPVLELILLILAFIHITAPEIYKNIQTKLHMCSCLSYFFEARTIVILSGIHLGILTTGGYLKDNPADSSDIFILYTIPILIYITCLVMNIIGIRIAAQDYFRYSIVRIAPVYNGCIFLTPRNHDNACSDNNHPIQWDLPISSHFEGTESRSNRYALKLSGQWESIPNTGPRLILRYFAQAGCSCKQRVALYILPLTHSSNLPKMEGRFFTFEEIRECPTDFSKSLLTELDSLKMAAEMWDKFSLYIHK